MSSNNVREHLPPSTAGKTLWLRITHPVHQTVVAEKVLAMAGRKLAILAVLGSLPRNNNMQVANCMKHPCL